MDTEKTRKIQGKRDKEIEVKINTEKQKQKGQNRDQETKSFRKGQREGLYYSLAYEVYPSFPTKSPRTDLSSQVSSKKF